VAIEKVVCSPLFESFHIYLLIYSAFMSAQLFSTRSADIEAIASASRNRSPSDTKNSVASSSAGVSSVSSRKKLLLALGALGAAVVLTVGVVVGTMPSNTSAHSSAVSAASDAGTSGTGTYDGTYDGKEITCSVVNGKYVVSNVPNWTACVDDGNGDVYDPELTITENGLEIELPWQASSDATVTFDLNQSQTCRQGFCVCVGPADRFRSVVCPPADEDAVDVEYQN
jgi:hypothetical protein